MKNSHWFWLVITISMWITLGVVYDTDNIIIIPLIVVGIGVVGVWILFNFIMACGVIQKGWKYFDDEENRVVVFLPYWLWRFNKWLDSKNF